MIVWPHVRQNVSGGLMEKYGVKMGRVKRMYFGKSWPHQLRTFWT